MKRFDYPDPAAWASLLRRPVSSLDAVRSTVENILMRVKAKGDQTILELTERIDGIKLECLKMDISGLETTIPDDLKAAIETARKNIEKFHRSEWETEKEIQTMPGVRCWRKSVPIETVGLYVPGGTAPLFSSLLMLGVPARIAGCEHVVVCTPPQKDGSLHPAIAFTAQLIGIETIYLVGGAQAIGAMAYGTETIPRVDKIFGPGNSYVTMAKQLVQVDGVAIDMPAGPSEVLVIADESGIPEFIASDLLSQAEHGVDSQVILVSTSEQVLEKSLSEISIQLKGLPRRETAEKALQNSKAFLVRDKQQAIALSNAYAPEHLIIASEAADEFIDEIRHAGSVFLGNYSCESAGDYASGTNHTLPTHGYARAYSGVSLDSFIRKITFQQITEQGLQNLGRTIEIMAEAEELFAHKNAVTIRLNAIEK
jgi:histidinol dehydrogenase